MSKNITEIEPIDAGFDEATLRRIDLNLILVFATIFRHGSVRAAAQRLYLGPSGVSMALRRLRSLASDPLFVRGKRGLEPTSFARALYGQVAPALLAIGDAMSPRSFLPEQARGAIRLALSDDLEIALAPKLTAALADLAPGLHLLFRHADYRRASALLDEGAADIVLTARPASVETRHRCENLLEERFIVLSPPGLFKSGRSITLEEYLAYEHALVSAQGSTRGRIDEALAEIDCSRTVRVITESFTALPFLLRRGNLIASVPRSAGVALAEAFGLAVHDLPLDSPSFAIAMTWRIRDEQDAGLRWTRELVRKQVMSLRHQFSN
ncbi:LysR family transcriptional regulator [Bradyrhizobium lablabi]|uniref:LysR family transcriptional regulator n=1 Tax=Bradyrhizobium lablabi TaxID=722472 RepID=UPI001BA98234|nr:LysR family transcriptional regulator [Bradyrhizobium lablabi]MBR0694024.1 LysR family transcriptional regulator [Bradyrhizobium lablabi]